MKKILKAFNNRTLSNIDRGSLYSKFSSLLEEGIPIFLILSNMEKIEIGFKNKGRAKLYGSWLAELKKGKQLAKVFQGQIPKDELSIIAAAEKTGELAQAFVILKEMVDIKSKITSKLLAAFLKPLGVIIVAILVIVFFSIKVFPVFESAIDIKDWPFISAAVYSVGKFFLSFKAIIFVISIAAAMLGGANFCVNGKGVVRKRLEKIFPFSLYERIVGAFFLNNLSMLLASRVPMLESVDLLVDSSQGWVADKALLIRKNLKKGVGSNLVLDVGLFDVITLSDLSIFLTQNDVGHSLYKVAKRDIERLLSYLDRLSEIVNLLLLLILGGFVGVIYYSIFLLTLQIKG